jgi:hypothetical protein
MTELSKYKPALSYVRVGPNSFTRRDKKGRGSGLIADIKSRYLSGGVE